MLHRFCHKVVSHHRLYDLVQQAAGAERVREKLMPLMRGAENQRVIDIGAGTGALKAYLPRSSHYIWVDNDTEKLRGYLSRGGGLALVGSALELGLAPKSVDQALCIAVAHHLADRELSRAFREIARVVRQRLIFLDPLDCPRLMSRMLWSIDRGSFPRSAEVLRRFLEESYVLEQVEVFTVLHRYLVCVAKPKPA
jgi:ubiquinone/menaquinone biosynthesis C-methylase UbiE